MGTQHCPLQIRYSQKIVFRQKKTWKKVIKSNLQEFPDTMNLCAAAASVTSRLSILKALT
jgi:hypothetical protein